MKNSTGRPRLLAIVGPTASGKTDLAASWARRISGEVVSVDSRQVYRGLDIGTAKPPAVLREEIPHHLIDVVDPDEKFDVARYCEMAHAAIEAIHDRGRPILLCGGTGLYLQAITRGLCKAPPADEAIRAELEREREASGPEALHRQLVEVDPAAAARIAPRDAVRIMRALEVLRATGRPLSAWQEEHGFSGDPYDVRIVVLSPPPEVLDRRIALRTGAMWEEGLLEETRGLLMEGFDGGLPPLRAIGYREAQEVLAGRSTVEEAGERMRIQTRRYAKRQRTWFRRVEGAVWLEDGALAEAIEREVLGFLEGTA